VVRGVVRQGVRMPLSCCRLSWRLADIPLDELADLLSDLVLAASLIARA
jgi:hypothetical protein